jgi:nitrite reductase/ring-hydroxylating ferredoxin subunit
VLDAERKSLGLRFGSTPQIVCPWHGFEFDVATGRHPGDARYRLNAGRRQRCRDGNIYVRAPA